MTPIRTNKPVFFGDNGEVLKNGFIYIGQPDSDPLDFPKSVTYQDATGSQFAAGQPLRTNSQGQISFNGKAIIALVDGDYSMLVQDFNQVTIKDGYTPLIEGVAEGGDKVLIYRSTLANLKQVNVTPGQYVENIGKVSQLDGEGARWLVVSNTGTSGDDVDLIDFANGTQGQRVENQLYGVKNLSDVDAADSRTNLSVNSKLEIGLDSEDSIELGGNFSSGATIKIRKVNDIVSIACNQSTLNYVSSSSSSISGFVIPSTYRPSFESWNTYIIDGAIDRISREVRVYTDGRIAIRSRIITDGTLTAVSSSPAFNITYIAAS